MDIKTAAEEFLGNKRIAVTGVSRNPQGHGANLVYKRLRKRGYDVFPVNPHADTLEGDRAYPNVTSIPGGVDAVVIATRPDRAEATMRECVDAGIKQVWMHRSSGLGSVSPTAAAYGREHGITVIDGGCPLMFDGTADLGHRLMKVIYTRKGNVPTTV